MYSWPYKGNYAIPGLPSAKWNSDTTNPSAWPLQANRYNIDGSHRCPGSDKLIIDNGQGILVAYRGSPDNQPWIEQIGLARAAGPGGPFTRLNNDQPLFNNSAEDPSVWRDKRGNWYMIMHALEGGFRGGPNVGGHAYVESLEGPWYYDTETRAFTTTVQFDDGTSAVDAERERPQLVFTYDGNMTPILLTSGVVENLNTMVSYSLAVPSGEYYSLWNTTNCVATK
ncbi:glycosyl hydrolase family 43 five-bladed beta-propellor domain protein [Fusarium sp. NRRL 52700]|nr:glycosyl hydrolase family 43 five-bladed beta-propellor domain protein [Fusarium sp. NRRL 52700]